MQARGEGIASNQLVSDLQTTLFFETAAEIYTRVFRDLKPRTKPPEVRVEFCPFANADSFIRLTDSGLRVRIADVLEGAPAPVMEALAYILLGKLFRRPVPRLYAHRYRLYLNRRDMRRQMHLVKQIRGRKFISRWAHGAAPAGMESRRLAIHAGAFRPLAQRHHYQQDFRFTEGSTAGTGVRGLPRDAASALSGGS